MNVQLKGFQKAAVNTLVDKFFRSDKKNIVFSAPTGSGKTVMAISMMDQIVENNPFDYPFTFIWLTPGNGELEEQSWESASKKATLVNAKLLPDALRLGIQPGDVTFINWELVKNEKKNVALRDGEQRNLTDEITLATQRGVHFVLIIDEEHRDQTAKAQKVIERFGADKIIRISATPKSKGDDFDRVQVEEDDAIAEGMIVRRVELNSGISEGDTFASTNEYFLNLADAKRMVIQREYHKLGKNINPLVLIQFPDEKGKADSDFMVERGELISEVESFLRDQLGQQSENIARWLSGDHFNVEDVARPDSPVNYLLMKQAISTGWDAPRAKILVKLRLNSDATFTLQTIGRIRRMPEQRHYDNELLDNAFVYSNDEKYVSEVMGSGDANSITSYSLNPMAPDFGLNSLKTTENSRLNPNIVISKLHEEFIERFKLGANTETNQEVLTNLGWDFGTTLKRNIAISDDLTKSIVEGQLNQYEVNAPIDLRKTRFTLLDREQTILKALPVNSPSEVNDILIELFSNRAAGAVKPPLLELNDFQLRAFIINNFQRITEVARDMQIALDIDLFGAVDAGELLSEKFNLPKVENYAVKSDEPGKLYEKNVYMGYSSTNQVKQSSAEVDFEEWLEHSENVKWWYRSSDRGQQYFSIAAGAKREGFFPDYLVQGMDERTYIFEVKHIVDPNSTEPRYIQYEQDAHQKFDALKRYVETDFGGEERFGFVQPIYKKGEVHFYFDNSEWNPDVNSNEWQPMNKVFE